MIVILNIETATKNCSVSLSQDGKLIGIKEVNEDKFSHAEQLHVLIEELLTESSLDFNDLSAVAVSKGPGSYTGLRIGVSSAKGLCFSLDIPLIAVDTLEILARAIAIEEGVVIPMIDARRMEVFTARFDKSFTELQPAEAMIIDADSFSDVGVGSSLYFIGDGALKCKEVLKDERFVFMEDVVFPSAKEMVEIVYTKFLASDFVDVAYFEPFYLKDFLIVPSKKK